MNRQHKKELNRFIWSLWERQKKKEQEQNNTKLIEGAKQ